jgi:hypothetical protein
MGNRPIGAEGANPPRNLSGTRTTAGSALWSSWRRDSGPVATEGEDVTKASSPPEGKDR